MDNTGLITLLVGIVPLVNILLQIHNSHSKKYNPEVREIKEHQLQKIYGPISQLLMDNQAQIIPDETIARIKEIHKQEYFYIDIDIHRLKNRIVDCSDKKLLKRECATYCQIIISTYEKLRKELGYNQTSFFDFARTKPFWLQMLYFAFIMISALISLFYLAYGIELLVQQKSIPPLSYLCLVPIIILEIVVLIINNRYYSKFEKQKKGMQATKPSTKK